MDVDIVKDLKTMVDDKNELAKSFRCARDRYKEGEFSDIKLRLIRRRTKDGRTHNLPTASEVAALVVGDIDAYLIERDIIIETQSKSLQRIDPLHPKYLALQYPLLFPYGEDGFTNDIPIRESYRIRKNCQRQFISMLEYFAYRIQERYGDSPILLHSRRLLQQFLVDVYTMVESQRLQFYRFNQPKLRVEQYKGLHECMVRGETSAVATGKRIILPSTFTGGLRYMFNNCKDAFAICRCVGYPSLFITITCNPEWPEIKRFVQKRGLKAEDRPDILCRIFKMKLSELIKDLKSGNVFGKISACKCIQIKKLG